MLDYASARRNMVEHQVNANRVTDQAVLGAMSDLPREAFVSGPAKDIAYIDEVLALGGERYMLEPMILGRLLQAAEIGPDDVTLAVGCGAGYAAAVLASVANTVVALESDKNLAEQATRTLAELGIDTVAVVDGPLDKGVPEQGPYDVIFFNGAVAGVPARVSDQLAEGGRLVAVIVKDGIGRATLMKKNGGILTSRELFDAGTPLLPGFEPESSFAFQ